MKSSFSPLFLLSLGSEGSSPSPGNPKGEEKMSQICPYCDSTNEVSDIFCIQCGMQLHEDTEIVTPLDVIEDPKKIPENRLFDLQLAAAILIFGLIVFSMLPTAMTILWEVVAFILGTVSYTGIVLIVISFAIGLTTVFLVNLMERDER